MNLQEMARREGLDESISVEREDLESGGILIRALGGAGGAEVVIAPYARKMYGEGPSINVALDRLRQLAEAEGGLPVRQGGIWHREELADY